jgi:hypothetical protein
MRREIAFQIGLWGIAFGIGCGGGSNGMPDAGPMDAGPMIDLPVLSTGTREMPNAGPADFACRGTRVEPAAGEMIPIEFALVFFGREGGPARNTRLWFFPDNVIRDRCEGTCVEVTTSADTGTAMVRARAGGWFAYRVFARMGPTAATTVVDSVQYNKPAPSMAGGSVQGSAVSQATLNLIPAVLGFPRQPGTALLAGRVEDCAGTPVYGAIVRVFEGSTEIAEGPANADPHFRYFNGDSTPDGQQPHTHVDGLYAAVNIPLPSSPGTLFRVEAWGRLRAADSPMRLGCEAVEVLADAVTIVNLGPMRSDYPTGHPCAN